MTGLVTLAEGTTGELATVTATGKESYTRSFTPLPEGFVQVQFNDMDALERAVDRTTAGVFLEPIQGEGGVYPAAATFLRVNAALLISAMWTIPVGVAIGFNPRLARVVQPLAQVLASVPASAFYPVLLIGL